MDRSLMLVALVIAPTYSSCHADRPLAIESVAISSRSRPAVSTLASASTSTAPSGSQSHTDPGPTDPSVIWEGASGGIHVRWTMRDLLVSSSGRPDGGIAGEYSLARDLRGQFDRELAATRASDAQLSAENRARGEPPVDANPCTVEHKVSLLSVVGSMVSLRDESYVSCKSEAHPGGETSFIVLEFRTETATFAERPKRRKLDQIFPSAQLFGALRKDPLLQSRHEHPPTTLAQLLTSLDTPTVAFDEKAQLCYSVPADFLGRFAFHHLEGDSVAVRVGLPGAGPCRYNLTQMGLLLPVPNALATALTVAAAKQEGFLMSDAAAISRGRRTSLTFGPAQ